MEGDLVLDSAESLTNTHLHGNTPSAARRVHDTPELLDLIQRLVEGSRKDFILASRHSWRCARSRRYRSVDWSTFLAIKRSLKNDLRQEALSMIKTINVYDIERHSYRAKDELVFTQATLLGASAECPKLSQIVSQEGGRGDHLTATFALGQIPHLLRRHTLVVKSIDKIQGCGSKWKALPWDGWKVSGALHLKVDLHKSTALSELDGRTEKDICASVRRILSSPRSSTARLTKLHLADRLCWSLEDLGTILQAHQPDGDDTQVTAGLESLHVDSVHSFTLTNFTEFATRFGSHLTQVHLNAAAGSPSTKLCVTLVPDLLDTFFSLFPTLADIEIEIVCSGDVDAIVKHRDVEQEESYIKSRWRQHTSLRRVKVYATYNLGEAKLDSVSTLTLVRRLLIRLDICRNREKPLYPSVSFDGELGFEINGIMYYFQRCDTPLANRQAFFKADFADLRLATPKLIQKVKLLPNGTFANWQMQPHLVTLDKARQTIDSFTSEVQIAERRVEASKASLAQISSSAAGSVRMAISAVETIQEQAKAAEQALVSAGLSVVPLVWPNLDQVPDFGEEQKRDLVSAQTEIDCLKIRIVVMEEAARKRVSAMEDLQAALSKSREECAILSATLETKSAEGSEAAE